MSKRWMQREFPVMRNEVVMLWSPKRVRLKQGNNIRECVGWQNRENAQQFCDAHQILFVDVERGGV